jgi:large subunit ribosomal protein L5
MKYGFTETKYKKEAVPELRKEFGYGNVMALPTIQKVIVNVGTGKFLKDGKKVDEILETIMQVTGQKPVQTKSKKSIAGFKLREGQEVGVKVTLRGKRMWQFLDRLLNATLPRIRDFQGLKTTIVDKSGNCNIGLREHMIFPEIVQEKVQSIFGLQITIVSSAKTREEAMVLFRKIGVPIRKDDKED